MVTMRNDSLRQAVLRVFTESFNQGDLSAIDEVAGSGTLDHQHPDEANFTAHLKAVVTALRTAFPDLHFEIVQMIGEDEWVAIYSVMTGTHTGPLTPPVLPPGGPATLPPTGRSIRVPHMHMIRFDQDGQHGDLYHLMDTFAMLGQLGLLPGGAPRG